MKKSILGFMTIMMTLSVACPVSAYKGYVNWFDANHKIHGANLEGNAWQCSYSNDVLTIPVTVVMKGGLNGDTSDNYVLKYQKKDTNISDKVTIKDTELYVINEKGKSVKNKNYGKVVTKMAEGNVGTDWEVVSAVKNGMPLQLDTLSFDAYEVFSKLTCLEKDKYSSITAKCVLGEDYNCRKTEHKKIEWKFGAPASLDIVSEKYALIYDYWKDSYDGYGNVKYQNHKKKELFAVPLLSRLFGVSIVRIKNYTSDNYYPVLDEFSNFGGSLSDNLYMVAKNNSGVWMAKYITISRTNKMPKERLSDTDGWYKVDADIVEHLDKLKSAYGI